MESKSLQRTPSKLTITTHLKLHKFLYEIEVIVIQITNLPIDTPGLGLIAQDTANKFVFSRNLLTAETLSSTSMSDDLSEIADRLVELEDQFDEWNLRHATIHHDDGSVCESCLNNESEGDDGSIVGEKLDGYEVMASPPPEESTGSDREKVGETRRVIECKRGETGKWRRRWWWRAVVILMPASVVVLAVSYFEKKQHEGFLKPT